MLKKLIKKSFMPLAVIIILLAILSSLFRALTPWATQYKGDIEQRLSLLIGQPVSIRNMETSWYWFKPVIKLDDVQVSGQDKHVLKLNKLLIGINLFKSLWHWQIEPGILYIDHAKLTIKYVHGHWNIEGLNQKSDGPITLEPETYLSALVWLCNQEKIIIKRVSATVHLQDGSILPITDLNLSTSHAFGHYHLKGSAKLAQNIPTELYIAADVKFDPMVLDEWSGRIYLGGHQVNIKQWLDFMPDSTYRLTNGQGNVDLWLDAVKGRLTDAQLKVNIQEFAWHDSQKALTQQLDVIQANVAWKKNQDGWSWSGDDVHVRKDGEDWPENSFSVAYRQRDESYQAFLKVLPIDAVMAMDLPWPDSMLPILKLQPRGQLHNTQITLQKGALQYFLTRFDKLSWSEHQTIPGVQHLSGVLHWEPNEGRLELDSQGTILSSQSLPKTEFEQLNLALDWKKLASGVRLSLDRLVVTRPDLVLSARGLLDKPNSDADGFIRLAAEFSGEKLQQWLPYLPSKYVKPKLELWLKENIKHIEKGSAEINLDGPLSSFPFDDHQGVFTINGYLSGADFLINKDWPMNRNVSAHIQLDKRTLTIDILRADLDALFIDDMRLRIDDLGRGHESLFMQSKTHAPMANIINYVIDSPLKSRFEKLKALDIHNPVGLEISLDIPLYPENNAILVRGSFEFDDNQLVMHPLSTNISFDEISGLLAFDERGVIDSQLKGSFAGNPLSVHIESLSEPTPHTMINAAVDVGVDWLQSQFYAPVLSLIQGHSQVKASYQLMNDDAYPDRLTFTSTLQGISVDLPAPLGTTYEDTVPLSISMEFPTKKSPMTLRFLYGERLSGLFSFNDQARAMQFDRGIVRIGAGDVSLPTKAGLHVKGKLPSFDLQQWQDTVSKLALDNSSGSILDSTQLVDLTFGDVKVFGKHYKDVLVRASRVEPKLWSIILKQQQVVADLGYQEDSNTLRGHVDYLHFNDFDFVKKDQAASVQDALKPKHIPNLDLKVDQFKLGDINVGELTLNSTSQDNRWILNKGKISSKYYQLSLVGEWLDAGDKSLTNLEADLHITSLEKLLSSWGITPAVEADHGRIQFEGSWPGALHDFSLETTRGQMQIVLKNGRITHLDPETEQKIGLGKLLSILSLQTIPRRLKFDFSDLSEDGYTFDIFKGHFVLKDGVLHTNDSYVNGPVAYASMKGDLDVVKRLYDIDLRVSPYITASLPVVATIAGGPVAGIATWVASNLITKGMQKISAYTYKISGPWTNPVVQQVHIYKKQTDPR